MPNELNLDNSLLDGFSDHAKERLKSAALEHLQELTAECYRIEAGANSGGGSTEVTQAMVNDAVVFKRRIPSTKTKKWWRIPLKVASLILPLLVGFFFNSTTVAQGNNLIFFVVLVAVTVAVMTASVLVDN